MGFLSISEATHKITLHHAILTSVFVVVVSVSFSYRRSVRRRLQQIREQSFFFGGLRMERSEDEGSSCNERKKRFKVFQLNPEFCHLNRATWRLQSLGDYLNSLKPGTLPSFVKESDVSEFINTELEAALSTALLRVLGPIVGRAALPALGFGPIPAMVERVSTELVGRFLANQTSVSPEDQELRGMGDAALLPVSIMGVWALSETNVAQYLVKATQTPLQKMKGGEYIVSGPSFSDAKFLGQERSLVPRRFVIATDWHLAIQGMEELLKVASVEATVPQESDTDTATKSTPYNPHSRSLGVPEPVNTRLFPDLHLGWGGVLCTHTQRQILKNRLLCTLLNRLAANYYYVDYRKEKECLFEVVLDLNDGSQVVATRPEQLVVALQGAGHQIQMQITTHPTTFGLALCVKEEEGWTNIPMATFLGSGYEDYEGHPAPALMPHSGLNLTLSGQGPLLASDDDHLSIQHFMGFEGFAGWQSNHNADVPWIEDINCGPAITDFATATRWAALYATTLNAVGADLRLPMGGYGLVGVCNDSAAVLESALFGRTSIYPLTAVGKYSMHAIRYARRFREIFLEYGEERKAEVGGLDKLIDAMKVLPSDIHASPSTLQDATRRMLHCLPSGIPTFQLMVDAKRLISKIHAEESMAKQTN